MKMNNQETTNFNKKVAKATKWSMITEVLAKFITPVVNMILARLLLPEAFGAVATITMIISFAEVFTDAGFQKYIVQHEFADDEDFNKSVNVAFWSNLALSTTLVLGIWIFRNQIATLVGTAELALGIAAASFSIIFVAFSSIQMAVYRRKLQFKSLFYVRVITSLIPLMVTVPLAIIIRNYWALVIGTLCMNLAQAVILTMKSDWKPQVFYSIKKFKEMFAFTSWTLFESVSIWMTANIGTFIVGRSLDAYYLGLYKTSMATVNSYISIISNSIMPVLFSVLSRYQSDDKMLRKTYFNFQKSMAILLVPMGIGLFVYRDLVVTILLGNQWTEASEFMGLWGLVSSISIILNNLGCEVCRSKGRPDISLGSQMIYLAFLIPALSISIKYSFKVLYITRSLLEILRIVITLVISSKIFSIKIRDNIKNILPQTFSALVMGVVAVLIKDIYGGIIWQIICIGICGIVYFGVLLLFPNMRKTIARVNFVNKIFNKFRRK